MVNPSPTSKSEVKSLLKRLRDDPIDATGDQQALLHPPLKFILTTSPDYQGKLHWFCKEADDVVKESAIFLFRLFAYTNDLVQAWKSKLSMCLHGCCDCVLEFGHAKLSCRSTYFAAFSDEVVERFWEQFEKWEAENILKCLTDVGISLTSTKTLGDAPPALVYHMVSTLRLLEEPLISDIVQKKPPSARFLEWPTDPPPPGLLLLLSNGSPAVRQWAEGQIKPSTSINNANFTEPHETVLNVFASMVSQSTSDAPIQCPSALSILLSDSPTIIWSGMANLVRLLPIEALEVARPGANGFNVRQSIFGHLHDNGPHFPHVLRCMLHMIEKLASKTWEGENLDYASVIFDAIKDNPSFCDMLSTTEIPKRVPWWLSWFYNYLKTVWTMPIFDEILAKIVGFLCGEAQHERFEASRPIAMTAAAELMCTLARTAIHEQAAKQYLALTSVLDIQSEIVIAVAMSRDYTKPSWSSARKEARELLRLLFCSDIDNLANTLTQLTKILPPSHDRPKPTFQPIRQKLWAKMYDNFQVNDSSAVSMMLRLAARSAHLDQLNGQAFSSRRLGQSVNDSYRKMFDRVVQDINRALLVFRRGFLDAIVKFSNYNTSDVILDLLQGQAVVKDIMALMISPVEDFHVAAQTLVGQAFDVDGRLDCFRVLFENLSRPSFRGLLDTVETFNQYAPQLPEACGVSKAMVRCMTDIIEVFCNAPDGLLLNEKYILGKVGGLESVATEIPRLWNLMSTSITTIFKRTPAWAEFFENEVMIEWMRDALIFGRDMLAQRRIFEAAALVATGKASTVSTPRKLSNLGRKMVDNLQPVLFELTRWLRLTDEELLHQSFALLQSLLDCFRQTNVTPLPTAVVKLTKFIDDGRTKSREVQSTRLDTARLSKLEDALASFEEEEDDDEIVVLSHNLGNRVTSGKQAVPKVDVEKKPPKAVDKFPTKKDIPSLSAKTGITAGSSQRPATTSAISKPLRFVGGNQFQRNLAASGSRLASNSIVNGKNAHSTSARVALSSSSGSDSDEEDKSGLKSLDKFQWSPQKIAKPKERRQVKYLDVPIQGRSAMHERFSRREDAHRTAMRLKPDISPLHRMILSWNYDHDGPDPPVTGQKPLLRRVPDQFRDYEEYLHTFEPLLMLECWSQIMKSKEETLTTFTCEVSSRQFIDDWLELEGFIRESIVNDWRLAETDIVLLRHKDDGKKSAMAKVTSFRLSPQGFQVGLRCYFASLQGDIGLQIGTNWRISKVFSLSTLHREYGALVALPYFDACDTILRPKLNVIGRPDPKDVTRAMTSHRVNEPQARAILTSMRTDGFSLIQGPPGTGKTWTICGLVGAFLSGRPRPSTAVYAGRASGQADRGPVKKIMICAPSNAAIDEVAKRLLEGVRDAQGSLIIPKAVRVGNEASLNISVKEISLNALVDQKMNPAQKDEKSSQELTIELQNLRTELESVKRLRQEKQTELTNIHDNASRTLLLEDEIRVLNTTRMSLSQKYDRLKDTQKSNSRTLDAARRKFRQEVLSEADVICSTLSGAGHEILENYDFEMVIIDEAAQAIELSCLIPLKFRSSRCIMVGDPQQLPPTVLSSEASKWGYDQSLFVRLQKHHPDAVHLLSIQYRMHPDISFVPSKIFYSGRLKDGPDLAVKTRQPWHATPKFGVYKFFSVNGGREETGTVGHSLLNKAECQVALALYDRLLKQFRSHQFDYRVGIVSMYRAQVFELRRVFRAQYGPDIIGKVDFNTVDGFQGQEKDIIILSCVRAGPGVQSVGFLADTRRMNVAITRARSSLYILGHVSTLERSNATWKQIIDDARSRSCLQNVDVAYFRAPAVSETKDNSPKASPSKSSERKRHEQPPPPVPLGLVKPKDFQSSSHRSKRLGNLDEDVHVRGLPVQENVEASRSSQKRPQVDDGERLPPAKMKRTEDSEEAPRPRPPRPRPKQAYNPFISRPPVKKGEGPSRPR